MSLIKKSFLVVPKVNIQQIIKYSIGSTESSTDSFSFKSKISQEESMKVLNTLNGSNSDQLSRYKISQTKIKSIESWKNKKGRFQSLSDILEVNGFSEKMLQNICENIINGNVDESEGTSKSKMQNKRVKQILTPPINGLAEKLTSATGVHLSPIGISWARLSRDGNKLNSWNSEDFSFLPKKMLPVDTFDQAINIVRRIPPSDVYIFEMNPSLSPTSQTQTAAVSSYTQQLELTSMLVALLNTSINHNVTLQNINADRPPQKSIENRIFHMRSRIPARLFRTLVGKEKVSAVTTVTQLVENNCDEQSVLPCTPITVEPNLRNAFISHSPSDKELLGQALLLVVSFMDICVHRNPVSMKAVSVSKNDVNDRNRVFVGGLSDFGAVFGQSNVGFVVHIVWLTCLRETGLPWSFRRGARTQWPPKIRLPAAVCSAPVQRYDDKPAPLRRCGGSSAAKQRRPACLSAAWADPPSLASKRERRRAICSWSVGYGTLSELDEISLASQELTTSYKKGKVADQTTLLEPPRGRRIVTTPSPHAPPSGVPASSRRPRRNSGLDDPQSPLVVKRRQGNVGETVPAAVKPASSLASLRKCETVLALTGYLRSASSSSSIEPLQPINRLRVSPHASHSRMCSRCSSLLTLASSSRYSLNSIAGGFVQVPPDDPPLLCKLCLAEVPSRNVVRIQQCECAFCIECMQAYVQFEINEGAYDISCPDAQCPTQGVLIQEEIKRLAGSDLLEKHKKYRLNREVELDKSRTWCPRAGCETVCTMCPTKRCTPQSIYCPTCTTDFCSNCKLEWHEGLSARNEGCAQMMCKRCKHVFCWYCLTSLDDDFLLRHYDKGPCKNKLGHSRASVIWHRTQVIGIFAGFGILLLVASPLLLLAAPCIVCCKCRACNSGTTKLDNEEEAANGEES
ncbi:hypothetical protein JTB14_001770 [Gonioctena quinquepunctata]|nr:hypothetical protein JTB14_001770 [Gonioctena quinquepunctata]